MNATTPAILTKGPRTCTHARRLPAANAPARQPPRIEMGRWLPSVAACQRRLADNPAVKASEKDRIGFIARATENELAAHALLRGDSIPSIRARIFALRGEARNGGQLCGLLDAIEDQEAGKRRSRR